MASKAAILRLQEALVQSERTINQLKEQLNQIKKSAVTVACMKEEERYRNENEKLQAEVVQLRSKLIEVETRNGVKQIPLPPSLKSSLTSLPVSNGPLVVPEKLVEEKPLPVPNSKQSTKPEKAQKKDHKTSEKSAAQPQAQKAEKSDKKSTDAPTSEVVDVSRLNMKIGKVVAVDKHPDADSLYVEQVDLGEGKNRTIVSGLVKHVPIEQMQNRLAVFLTNLKPAKMRGILSEGMIMCVNVPEKVMIIDPPEGAKIGDRVTVEGFPGEPDDMLNPKKKIWEAIMPDLRTNDEGIPTYKGAPWKIDGKGHFNPTLINGQIK